jgi:hypothetical protein
MRRRINTATSPRRPYLADEALVRSPRRRPATARGTWWYRVLAVLVAGAAALMPAASAQAIVGGNAVDWAGYPYLVSLDANGLHCDGSVIAGSWILTAAHCLDYLGPLDGPSDVSVYGLPLTGPGPSRQWTAQAIDANPLWDDNASHGHDLALIRLAAGALAGIPPVQLGAPWDAGAYAPGIAATIMGDVNATQGYVNVSQVQVQSDSYMDSIFNWNGALMIGAGSPQHTVCHGDSGGPLVVNRNNRPVQIGLVSFGTEHCDNAAGFTELSRAQLAWVASLLPAVAANWGGCPLASGAATGQPVAAYSAAPSPARLWTAQTTGASVAAGYPTSCGTTPAPTRPRSGS